MRENDNYLLSVSGEEVNYCYICGITNSDIDEEDIRFTSFLVDSNRNFSSGDHGAVVGYIKTPDDGIEDGL